MISSISGSLSVVSSISYRCTVHPHTVGSSGTGSQPRDLRGAAPPDNRLLTHRRFMCDTRTPPVHVRHSHTAGSTASEFLHTTGSSARNAESDRCYDRSDRISNTSVIPSRGQLAAAGSNPGNCWIESGVTPFDAATKRSGERSIRCIENRLGTTVTSLLRCAVRARSIRSTLLPETAESSYPGERMAFAHRVPSMVLRRLASRAFEPVVCVYLNMVARLEPVEPVALSDDG